MFSPVILAAPPLLSLLLLLSTSQQVHSKTIINFGILLPNKTANQLVTRDPCSDLDIVIAESSITLASIGALLKWTPNDSAIHLNISYHDSKCSDSFAPFAAMELYYRGTIHALFGPCCKYALSPVGRYAKFWNIPVITTGGLTHVFANEDSFSMLTRFVGPYTKLGRFLANYILDVYGWRHLFFLYTENYLNHLLGSSDCYQLIDDFLHVLRSRKSNTSSLYDSRNSTAKQLKYNYTIDIFDESNLTSTWLNEAQKKFDSIRNKSRVVIMCASPHTIREILIKMAEKKIFQKEKGEYVIINIDLFSSFAKLEKPWFRSEDTDEHNSLARTAYERLLTVTMRKPVSAKYKDFSADVLRRTKEMNPQYHYNEEEGNFIGSFHDATMLYLLALNETLAAGSSATNGTEITRRMRNRSFEGITGNVSMDENGDRKSDYSVLDMNKTSGLFEVISYGNEDVYVKVPGKEIHWGGDVVNPPLDEPKCGFDDLGCPETEPFPSYGIALIIMALLLCGVTIVALFVYRRLKLKADLAEINWRVRWEDIMFGAQEKRKLESSGSRLSLARVESEDLRMATTTSSAQLIVLEE